MKKYKHKQTGYIAQQCAGINYQLLKDIEYSTNIPKEIVENSNDWQEIIEKDYEILSFINPKSIITYLGIDKNTILNKSSSNEFKGCDSKRPVISTNLNRLLNNNNWNIHSVKRLSDGEVFTIADEINSNIFDTKQQIKDFYFLDNILKVRTFSFTENLNNIEHIKKPLFTTEDGVDIFEGDEYHNVNSLLNYKLCKADSFDMSIEFEVFNNLNENKTFSTKLEAEKYIVKNEPCLSYNDIMSLSEPYHNGTIKLKNNVPQKTFKFKEYQLTQLIKDKLK